MFEVAIEAAKTKFMVVGRSRNTTPGYGDPTPSSAELEKVDGLHILGVTVDSKLTFETHFREVVSKAARTYCAPSRRVIWLSTGGKGLFQCICFAVLEYCAHVWMSSALG